MLHHRVPYSTVSFWEISHFQTHHRPWHTKVPMTYPLSSVESWTFRIWHMKSQPKKPCQVPHYNWPPPCGESTGEIRRFSDIVVLWKNGKKLNKKTCQTVTFHPSTDMDIFRRDLHDGILWLPWLASAISCIWATDRQHPSLQEWDINIKAKASYCIPHIFRQQKSDEKKVLRSGIVPHVWTNDSKWGQSYQECEGEICQVSWVTVCLLS